MARALVADVINFLRDLANDENLRVTVQQAVRGGCIAGGAAVGGALLGGPIGMAVAGTVGSLLAAATSNDFKPVAQIINEMPPHQKEQLATKVNNIMANNGITSVAALAALVAGGGAIKTEIVQELQRFVTDELHHAIAH